MCIKGCQQWEETTDGSFDFIARSTYSAIVSKSIDEERKTVQGNVNQRGTLRTVRTSAEAYSSPLEANMHVFSCMTTPDIWVAIEHFL